MSEVEVQELHEKLDRIEKSLLSQKSVLTFEECCQYTGWSESHLYKLTSKRLIPHSKPGGKDIFFEREKIDEFLLKNPIKTQQEINQEANSYVLRKATRENKKTKIR